MDLKTKQIVAGQDGRYCINITPIFDFLNAMAPNPAEEIGAAVDRLALLMVENPEAFPDREEAGKLLQLCQVVRKAITNI